MNVDVIREVKIDDLERLCLFPQKEKFHMIYQTATEVHWNNQESFLYSPKPREWSYFDWYVHIVTVVEECGYSLLLNEDTKWTNIPLALRQQIIAFQA